MNDSTIETNKEAPKLAELETAIGWLAVAFIIVSILFAFFTYTNWKSADTTNTKIESMSVDVASLNWDMLAVKHTSKENGIAIDRVNKDVYDKIHEIQVAKSAKIYNLDVTICKENLITNSIDKRIVRMDNIVAINPSVQRTATIVDTWIDYNGVEIPGIMNDERSYACDLHIISVK